MDISKSNFCAHTFKPLSLRAVTRSNARTTESVTRTPQGYQNAFVYQAISDHTVNYTRSHVPV